MSTIRLSLCLASLVLGLACRDRSPPPPAQEAPAPDSPEGRAARAAPQPPAIVFLGDSLTAGFGLAASESVPALIEARLRAASLPYQVINAGRSGDTSAGGLARLPWYLRKDPPVAAFVIWLGANDAMRGLDLGALESNLRRTVQAIRAFDPTIRVFLVQMHTFPSMGQQFAGEFSAIFPRVARAENAELLPFPLEGVAGVPALNQPDGIHPTAEGTRRVADHLWRALAPQLRPGR